MTCALQQLTLQIVQQTRLSRRGLFRSLLQFSAVACALFLSATSSLHAGLKWEKQLICVAVETKETEAVARFPFVNDTSRTIKITALRTNCGCTAATAGNRVFEPGEHGEVTVTYRIGQRRGYYETPVLVKTDAPDEPDTTLKLRLLIRDAVEVTPQLVFWHADEKPEPKTLRVEATAAALLKNVSVTASDPSAVKIDVLPIKQGRVCEIRLTPPPDGTRARTRLNVETELSDGKKATTAVYVRAR